LAETKFIKFGHLMKMADNKMFTKEINKIPKIANYYIKCKSTLFISRIRKRNFLFYKEEEQQKGFNNPLRLLWSFNTMCKNHNNTRFHNHKFSHVSIFTCHYYNSLLSWNSSCYILFITSAIHLSRF